MSSFIGIDAALDKLGDDARDLQFLFATVDPERDTREVMAEYVPHFHPSLVGLTGTSEQVAAMAKAYRVYYKRVERDGDDDYLMDHSSIFYLMGPDGRFVSHFPYTTNPDKFVEGLRKALGKTG